MRPVAVLFVLAAIVCYLVTADSVNGTTSTKLPSTSAPPSWRFWKRNVVGSSTTTTTDRLPSEQAATLIKQDLPDASTTTPSLLNSTNVPATTSEHPRSVVVTSFNATTAVFNLTTKTNSRVRREADNSIVETNVTVPGGYPTTHSLAEGEVSDVVVTTPGHPTTHSRVERQADHTSAGDNLATLAYPSTQQRVRREAETTPNGVHFNTAGPLTTHSLVRREVANATDVNLAAPELASTHSFVRRQVGNATTTTTTTTTTDDDDDDVNVTTSGYQTTHTLVRRDVANATGEANVTTPGYASTHSVFRRTASLSTDDANVILVRREAGNAESSAETTGYSTDSRVQREAYDTPTTSAATTSAASTHGRYKRNITTLLAVSTTAYPENFTAGLVRREAPFLNELR